MIFQSNLRAAPVAQALFYLLLVLAPAGARADDGHVEQGGERFQPNPKVVSPPILQQPIYACADTVVVKGFVPHAGLKVFVAGTAAPIGVDPDGISPDFGQPVKVSIHFTAGQVITAVQVKGGVTSAPSNAVTVTSYRDDYPAGLPQPRIDPAPCLDCGAAVGSSGVIPGATWTVFAEDPKVGGGFNPPMQIGSNQDFPYTLVSPRFKSKQRITIRASLCADTSQPSQPEIVQPDPAIPPATVASPVIDGADRVVVTGPASSPVLNGAALTVFADYGTPPSKQVGGQPSPGGLQQVLINPHAPAGNHVFSAQQALCSASPPGPKTPEQPCSKLPAAQIRPPLPGDSTVEVTQFVPGSEIRIYVTNGGMTQEIGDGGGSQIALTQPIKAGDTVIVVQSLGPCQGNLVFVVLAGCGDRDPNVCSGEWPAFRHSGWRDGQQPASSVLTDTNKVRTLKSVWQFIPGDSPKAFKASPIVFRGRVFIGNGNGRLYALDAASGKLLWEYPKPPAAPLTSKYAEVNLENPSSAGIAASASIALIENRRAVVVFGAPDRSIGAGLGSGRLFALDPVTGNEVWKSPEIAVVNGLTSGATNERHEQIGYSSPLVLGNRIYVGIADHGDDPIQAGRVVAVDTNSGAIAGGFTFNSTGTRGGGIWSSVAGGLDKNAIAITTGNARNWNGGSQSQPTPDHSLSMLGLNGGSGSVNWELRAVPFNLDNDPDWAAGPALLDASCGHAAASTQKDGWSYAARSNSSGGGSPSVLWQFPPTGIPFTSGDHDDTRYIKPGAGWNDTYITMDAGHEAEAGQPGFGFTRLHALNVCASPRQPVRWIADIPDTTPCMDPSNPEFDQACEYQLGPPTVTRGIVFVGTSTGHLVVLADPSVYLSVQSVCSNPEVSAANCSAMGYALVPKPIQLNDVNVGAGGIQTEPALAGGRVFLATDGGSVVMLQP